MSSSRIILFVRDDRGGPLVEMAILLLPFVLIIAMVIEGGNILWRYEISLKSARDTTRYLSRVPLLFDENCGINATALSSATVTAKNLGISGLLDGGAPLIANWTPANIDVAAPEVISTDPCLVIVQATANVELPLPFAPVFQLFDPSRANTISFSVADRSRWLGE